MGKDRPLLPADRSHLLYMVTLLNDAGINILVFSISRNLAESGAGLFLMGIFGAAFSLTFAASSFVFGAVSDRGTKKLFMYLGILVLLASSLLCYLLPPASPLYLLAYTLAGCSGGLLYPPLISWLNQKHSVSATSRGVSSTVVRFSISWNLGVLLGNYSAGRIFELSPTAPLLLAAVFCVVNLVILAMLIPAAPVVSAKQGSGGNFGEQVASPPLSTAADNPRTSPEKAQLFVTVSWVANIGGAFVGSMILHLFPKLAVDIGIPPELHGVLLGIMRGAVISTYLVMHVAPFWQYRLPVLLSLQVLSVTGLAILYCAESAAGVLTGLICLAFLSGHNYFAGLFYGNANSSHENRGASSGFHQGTIATGIMFGSLGGGIIGNSFGIRAPYLLAIVVTGLLTSVQVALYIRYLIVTQQRAARDAAA